MKDIEFYHPETPDLPGIEIELAVGEPIIFLGKDNIVKTTMPPIRIELLWQK